MLTEDKILRRREIARAYYRRNREACLVRGREQARRANIRKMFGISPEQYLELFEQNGGRCEICSVEIALKNGSGRSACLDHDHQTGKLRGFLCSHCNRGIGGLRDDVNLLRKAIDYLEKHA